MSHFSLDYLFDFGEAHGKCSLWARCRFAQLSASDSTDRLQGSAINDEGFQMITRTLTCETKRIKRQDCVSQHYCGRRLGQIAIPRSDGRCGPNNGRQCASCARYQASVGEAVVEARSVDREATTSTNQAAFAFPAMAAFAREPGRARAPDDQAALHRQDGEPETTLGQGAKMCVATSQLSQAAVSQLISNEGSKDSTPAVKVRGLVLGGGGTPNLGTC